MATPIRIDIGPGELADRISILRIKRAHLAGEAQARAAAQLAELETLWRFAADSDELDTLLTELARINDRLWQLEDALRACEARKDFGPDFIEHARGVYRVNDRRAELKAMIDSALGHAPGDSKVYATDAATGAEER